MNRDRYLEEKAALIESNVRRKGWGAPHCDDRVVHSPGKCRYCDGSGFQELMRRSGLKYADQLEEGEPLLPWVDRTAEHAHQWPGNTPEGYPSRWIGWLRKVLA